MLSTTVYTKPTQCRLNPVYTTAYATYALCMEADAPDITCVEFPLYSLFCIQEKKKVAQIAHQIICQTKSETVQCSVTSTMTLLVRLNAR